LNKLIKILDSVFSKHIRKRSNECYTCGFKFDFEDLDCGHYIPRKHLQTRFDEVNCQTQCKVCNQLLNGNLKAFRQRLIEDYGLNEVQRLEHSSYILRRYSDVELRGLIERYKS
jgi:hypothetical protein